MFNLTQEQMKQNEKQWLSTLSQGERDWVKSVRDTNAALAGYRPDPTHQMEAVDSATQNAGESTLNIPSEYVK